MDLDLFFVSACLNGRNHFYSQVGLLPTPTQKYTNEPTNE